MNRREFLAGLAAQRIQPAPPPPDFPGHARASMRFLEHAVDDDGIIHFWIRFRRDRTEFEHDHWDWSENTGRLLYGRMYARKLLGDASGIEFEHRIARLLAGGIGPDGLHYYPRHGAVRPAQRGCRPGRFRLLLGQSSGLRR